MDQQYPQQYFRRWHLATPSQRILKVLADTEPLARLKCFCFWHAPYAYQIRLKTQMLILALMGLDPADPHLPFFLVVDEQHHRKCGLGDTPPGGDYPDGLVSSAPTLRQLASSSASAASSWRARWQASTSTSRGEDPGFGRGHSRVHQPLLDWVEVADLLSDRYRICAMDFPG